MICSMYSALPETGARRDRTWAPRFPSAICVWSYGVDLSTSAPVFGSGLYYIFPTKFCFKFNNTTTLNILLLQIATHQLINWNKNRTTRDITNIYIYVYTYARPLNMTINFIQIQKCIQIILKSKRLYIRH